MNARKAETKMTTHNTNCKQKKKWTQWSKNKTLSTYIKVRIDLEVKYITKYSGLQRLEILIKREQKLPINMINKDTNKKILSAP